MEHLTWFETEASAELVAKLGGELSKSNELQLISKYRKAGYSPDLIRFALEQAKLRVRGRKKFGADADQMFFTEAGLEQATRADVANWHAELFVKAGLRSVTDLGCGIGSDSIAFAKNGLEVFAIDNHEAALAAARANLRSFGNVVLAEGSAEDFEVTTEAVYLDPARRDQERKSAGPLRLRPQDFSPSLDFAFDLARKFPSLIKLSPGFPHELIPEDFEADWVSKGSDLVEVLLRSNSLGIPGAKKAVMANNQVLEFEGVGIPGQVGPIAEYLFEPDAALVRSHLIGDFANHHGLSLISAGIAYLTAAKDVNSPWLKRFRVLEVLPLKEKPIRDYCNLHNIGTLEIKKRGVDITPEELRPKLRLKGTGVATLILTKVGDARQAIVCESIR